jgi:glucose-1-phosphate thymidylyltransferase
LILAGIREILVITTERDLPLVRELLGDGSRWGLEIQFIKQDKPNGIAEAYIIAETFLGISPSLMILGDNIFHGNGLGRELSNFHGNPGAAIQLYWVSNPQDFGVANIEGKKIIAIDEKPKYPKSNWAIPGIYAFDNSVSEYAKKLTKSNRGELEITDLLNLYLKNDKLTYSEMGRGTAWLDIGTPSSLLEASLYVKTLQTRQGTLIGSPDEAAYTMNLIDKDQLARNSKEYFPSEYSKSLLNLIER